MTTALLSLRDLTAGYDRTPVVRSLNLDVEAGEMVALLGPNGAGKTTTLLTATGFLPAIGGTIDVLGARPDLKRPELLARRGVVLVPEHRALWPQLTVGEHLRVAARGRVAVPAAFPELEHMLDLPAGLLSGGEQQMLALARALVLKPRLLILDELSLGLAPLVVQRLFHALREFADLSGAGVLFVEQHVHRALDVADRAYVLQHGEVVLSGPSGDLGAQPSVLDAAYLGRAGGRPLSNITEVMTE